MIYLTGHIHGSLIISIYGIWNTPLSKETYNHLIYTSEQMMGKGLAQGPSTFQSVGHDLPLTSPVFQHKQPEHLDKKP